MVERVDTVRGAEGCRNRDLATSSRRRAFESAGVEFIDENGGDLSAKAATSSEGAGIGRVEFIDESGGGPGVRLRERQTARNLSRSSMSPISSGPYFTAVGRPRDRLS